MDTQRRSTLILLCCLFIGTGLTAEAQWDKYKAGDYIVFVRDTVPSPVLKVWTISVNEAELSALISDTAAARWLALTDSLAKRAAAQGDSLALRWLWLTDSLSNRVLAWGDSLAARWLALTDSLNANVARNSVSVDTALLVSMNRDDIIRGEKIFNGDVTVTLHLAIGTSTFPGGVERFYIQHDTATKRLGNTVAEMTQLGSTSTWELYESGIIDQDLQSSARAYRNATQSLTAGVRAKVQFNAESWDTQSEFDPSTNYNYVARTPGTYLVTAKVSTSGASATNLEAFIYVSGAVHTNGPNSVSFFNGFNYYAGAAVTDLVEIGAAGQTIEIRAEDSAGNTIQSGSEVSYVSIVKVK